MNPSKNLLGRRGDECIESYVRIKGGQVKCVRLRTRVEGGLIWAIFVRTHYVDDPLCKNTPCKLTRNVAKV